MNATNNKQAAKTFRPVNNSMLLLVLLVITTLVYLGVRGYDFVNWDDDDNIRSNPRYTEMTQENIAHHFYHDRYKALAIWSYMAEYQLFGRSAKAHHTTNLCLHLLNVLLVYVLMVMMLPQKRRVALIVASFFALHPVFVEVVAWITGRKDLLFVCFALIAMMTYKKYLQSPATVGKWLWFALTCITVYISSLAKIQAFAIPVLLFLFDWFTRRKAGFISILEKLAMMFLIFGMWLIVALLIAAILLYSQKQYLKQIVTSKPFPILILVLFWAAVHSAVALPGVFSVFANVQSVKILVAVIAVLCSLILVLVIVNSKTRMRLQTISLTTRMVAFVVVIAFSLWVVIENNYANLSGHLAYNINPERFWLLFKGLWSVDSGHETFFSIGERFLLLGSAAMFYLQRYFLIKGVDPMIPYPTRDAAGNLPAYMLSDLIVVLVLVAIAAFILFRYYRSNRLVWFGVMFFIINISLVLHIIPIEGRILAGDRYTYLPYIGLFLLVGLAADYFIEKNRKAIVLGVLGLCIIAMGFSTYRDKEIWRNSISLWQHALSANPTNHYAMYSLGLAYFAEKSDPASARQLLDRALEQKKDFMYYNNRGRVRYAMGDLRGALGDFDNALAIDTNSYAAYNNRGATRLQFCDFKGALLDYQKALAILPNYTDALTNKAKVLNLMYFDSIVMQQAQVHDSDIANLISHVLEVSEKMLATQQQDRAIDYLNKGIALMPNNAEMYEKLAVIYHLNMDYATALQIYSTGLDAIHDNAALLLGRGILFVQTGDTIAACRDLSISAAQGDSDAQQLLMQFCK